MSTASAQARPPIAVAVGAGTASLALAGQGLLLPAGGAVPTVRVVAALVALSAVAVLVRREGPLDGGRSLAVVAVAALVVGVATIPWSPITVRSSADLVPATPTPGPDVPGSIVLDRVGPGQQHGPVLRVPPGMAVALEGGQVVLRDGNGNTLVLGDARPPDSLPGDGTGGGEGVAPDAAPVPPAEITITDGVVGRSDGGVIGPGTPLGGTTLSDGAGARVFVADGVLLPIPSPTPVDDADPFGGDGDGDGLAALFLLVFAIVAFAPPVVRVMDRVTAPLLEAAVEDEPEPTPAPASSVEAGLADVLGSMLADPDPRTAVIGAYARLLAALAEVGFARRAEETPHEHLWRCLGPLGVRRAPVHRLAELFVRARFTPHPITETHRQAAINALADTVADLRLRASDVDAALAGVGADAGARVS